MTKKKFRENRREKGFPKKQSQKKLRLKIPKSLQRMKMRIKIKALEDELSAQKDKYMRLAAEYDNYRKRTANEKLSIYDDATSKAVSSFFPLQTA